MQLNTVQTLTIKQFYTINIRQKYVVSNNIVNGNIIIIVMCDTETENSFLSLLLVCLVVYVIRTSGSIRHVQ